MAGENLGMKVDLSSGSNALVVDGRNHQWKRRNFNDHQWIVQQTCWWCRKVGHICQGCMASQVEWDAYQEKKLVEHDTVNAQQSLMNQKSMQRPCLWKPLKAMNLKSMGGP